MSRSSEQMKASAIGGAVGMILGILGGCLFALCLNGFTNGMAWFAIPHITLAMVLMGLWLVPCLVPDTTEEEEKGDSLNSVQLAPKADMRVSNDSHAAA